MNKPRERSPNAIWMKQSGHVLSKKLTIIIFCIIYVVAQTKGVDMSVNKIDEILEQRKEWQVDNSSKGKIAIELKILNDLYAFDLKQRYCGKKR